MPSLFTFPNRILFGEGSADELPAELARLGVRRPLVVTDAGLVAAGLVAKVVGPLGEVPVFDRVQPNPTEADVLDGLDRYRAEGCDGVVGPAAAAPIDAAPRRSASLATHLGRLVDYDFAGGGPDKITADLPPMVAIPTTAGTGSEAGRGTLIQLPQNGRKTIALSPYLLPSARPLRPDASSARRRPP